MNAKQLAVLVCLVSDGKPLPAPSYMEEKIHQVMSVAYANNPETLLDSTNKDKYKEWVDVWHTHLHHRDNTAKKVDL